MGPIPIQSGRRRRPTEVQRRRMLTGDPTQAGKFSLRLDGQTQFKPTLCSSEPMQVRGIRQWKVLVCAHGDAGSART